MKPMAVGRSIGVYLALAFSALSILLTTILAEIIVAAASGHVKTNIAVGLEELAVQTADKLDRGMYERYREVQLLSKRRSLIASQADRKAQREVLDARQDTYPYYAWIGITDMQGRVRVATGGLLEGADVSSRPWFRGALNDTHVGDVHEAVLLAKLLAPNSSEPLRFVDLAFPFHDPDTGQPGGVLGVHLSWEWARDVERSVFAPVAERLPVEAMIVDRQGQVLLGPPGLQGQTLEQPALRALQGDRAGVVTDTWSDGKEYLLAYSRTDGHDGYPGLGWTVLVRQPLEVAYAPVRHIQRQVLWSGIALALLFSALGWLAARRIVRPLRWLASSAQRIRAGQAGMIDAGPRAYTEVQALTGSLNALVSNLQHKEAELRALNQNLEQRVAERTTELEHALAEVQASERRIETIIMAAHDAFIATDLEGRVIGWNPQAERTFGWSSAEANGRLLAELVLPPRFRAAFQHTLHDFRARGRAALPTRRIERVVIDRSGREFPVEVTIALVGEDERAFFSAFLHDISERKQNERMKNEFISTVSHELRTPLTAIRASLSLLVNDMRDELAPSTLELLDIAHRSCERLVRLVNDMLDIEKIESGNMGFVMQRQNLLPLLSQALDSTRPYAEQYQVTMRIEEPAHRFEVMADADHMIQVFVNLLSNAVKFSPPQAEVVMRLAGDEENVIVSVIDCGSGIPDAFRPRMFEKFAQADASDSRRKGGTGLGLAICKSIVERHGGTIDFDSIEGKGTTFHVRLPRASAGE